MKQPTEAELNQVALLFKKGSLHNAHRYQDHYRRQYGYKAWDRAYEKHTKAKNTVH